MALFAYGPQNISELSRNSGVERTRLYRLIDTLKGTNLIDVEVAYKRSIFKAAPVSNLQILISKKEQEVLQLHAELTNIEHIFGQDVLRSPVTRVQFYKGDDGLKQMIWNQTRYKKTENLSILYENMQHRTQLAFFERWVRKINEEKIVCRGIISDHFLDTQRTWYANHSNERIANWQARYVPDSVFPITHSMVIYGDVVSYYNWKDGEIFGIEIYNEEIADAQRQFFEMLWLNGQLMSKKVTQVLPD